MAPIRIWAADGSAVIAAGEVPVTMLQGKSLDRAALFRELSKPKKEKPSTTDVMGDMLRGAQKRTRAATLQDLQSRVEQIEARLGIGRKPAGGFFPAEVIAPPPGGGS